MNLTVLSLLAETMKLEPESELSAAEFLLERVLELESLSIPDFHRLVPVTGTQKRPLGEECLPVVCYFLRVTFTSLWGC